jgi:glycosyltransferase involved in cell wall biosynthesis
VGGVESTIYHHARLLKRKGYQVSISAGRGAAFDDSIEFISLPEVDSRHPEVERISDQLALGEVTEDFINLRDKLTNILSTSLSDTNILIVHNAVTLHKNLPLTAALKQIADQQKLRLIAWCHDFAWQDSLYTPDLHPGYPWDLLKTNWEGVDYVAVSEHRQRRLAELLGVPPSNIQVIQPGVDAVQFLNLSPSLQKFSYQNRIFESDPIILLPARITRRKNIEFAVQVVSHLKIRYSNVALIISGPPGPHNPKNIEYLDSLLGMRDSQNLNQNIHFVYQLNGADEIFNAPDEFITGLYRISDLVIFPRFREGFGIPVLEAGLVKIPIFAADIPPVRESSAGMINLFDPHGDPAPVADMIFTHLQSDRAYKFHRHVLSEFTWDSILEKKIIPLIERIAAK